MKIFNFTNRLNRWKRVEDEMYLVWLGNQTGSVLPRWQDSDFKNCMKKTKSLYTLRECEANLHLI